MDRWQQINQLFHSALAHERDQRAAFLVQACAGDEALRAEVESLVASHEQAESFIERPAADVAAELLAGGQNRLGAGQQLGHYTITDLLGAGGMGEVYLAEDLRLGRRIALKLLPAQFTVDGERVRRFEQEARAASALNHPNIVTIYEIGRENSTHFIATEFIDGETLRASLSRSRLSLREALDMAIQVASAISAAHKAGIVHRDIKPENIMVRRDDRLVKVLDFGLAKLMEMHARQRADSAAPTRAMVKTDAGVVMGTVSYMSPEQARGLAVDERTDIWSLGVLLYEMVAGHLPFAGETASDVIAAILKTEPPVLNRYAPDMPAELERIVTKALRKDAEERYQSSKELALDLKSLKQRLEFEAELERTGTPERSNPAPSVATGGQPAEIETAPAAAAQTGGANHDIHTTSSAEYLVSEIKRHRRGAALAAAAVLIAVAALAYFFYPTSGGEAIDSVAVLPFVNVSGDPNTEYLSDGISDSVINSLSRLPKLRVISLNSVLRYRGKQIDSQAVGRELNVRAVLMGRMTQRGDGLAISTELVDVRDNSRLWGGQYNRKLSDIFEAQEEIAREISDKLQLRLSGEQKKVLTKRYTDDAEAYKLYLKGIYYRSKWTEEGWKKGIEHFKQAIERDPNYALAYAGLANTYVRLGLQGVIPPKDAYPKAKAAALKAVKIDDTLGAAHASLGLVKQLYDWDWSGAKREYQRAIELNPNHAGTHYSYSYHFVHLGQLDEAITEIERVKELDPLSVEYMVGAADVYKDARRYDQVIEECRKALEMDSNYGQAYLFLGQAYEYKGMYEEAIAEYQKAISLIGNTPEISASLGHAYAVSGRRDEARKVIKDLKELSNRRYVDPTYIAVVYAGLGENDQAFHWLEKAFEDRSGFLVHAKVEPIFDDLRGDPRFTDLLRRMNLAP